MVPVPKGRLARTPNEARDFASALGIAFHPVFISSDSDSKEANAFSNLRSKLEGAERAHLTVG
jgi:hypothetical protein